ncbi:MAG TPA: metalloprotease PmbA [Gammaproteobacteria bacterium]|nr:metalloprotease PmbA [Gammaproteobacteria bacterium]
MDQHAVGESLQAVAAQAVALARKFGSDQAEVGVSYEEGLSVSVRMGELESVERQRDRGLAITVYRNQCKGSASTTDFSATSIEETVRKAISIGSFTTADEYAGLADAELMAKNPQDLELYFPWGVDVDQATDLALRSENAARSLDPRIANSEGASVSSGVGQRVYANSHGFVGSYPTSTHSMSCSVLAKAGESLERDYWYTVSRHPDDMESPEEVGQEAARRAVQRLEARTLSTRKVPVLYPAELAKGLFGHLIAAVRGTAQYRRASFLLDAAGKPVLPSFIDIEEDPWIPRALASAPFDAEGVQTRRRKIVEQGVLQGYVLSSYSARRLGLTTTGNAGGVHNLLVKPTAGTLEDLIKDCDEAFVVGELLGQGVNTVTGDYSRGAAGFWVERGAIVHPVHEVTIAGNLKDLFREIQAVGSDIDSRGTVRCGAVRVDGLTLAGGG